jgi:hypothetical protein
MGSSSKRRQTMAKMERERNVKEKRAKKQERKEEKKAMREAGIDPMSEFATGEYEARIAEGESPAAAEESPVER